MTYRTLGLLVTLTLAILVAPLAAEAQLAGKVARIAWLASGFPPAEADRQRSPFFQALRALGWVEGQNIAIEPRYAEERSDRLPALAAELIQLNVDVIVAGDSPTLSVARQATHTIPIVGFFAVDPVADGLVASLAHPGGNLTGVSGMVPELSSKLLELLKMALPKVTRVAVLSNPVNPTTGRMVTDVERAADALGVQLHTVQVRTPEWLEPAFGAATRGGADALLILPSLLFSLHEQQLAALALKSRLPAIYWRRSFADRGGLMAYGPDLASSWRHAAAYVDKILKGAKPGDLPVEQPTTFELVINLKTADALGLTIPPIVLFQATEVLR